MSELPKIADVNCEWFQNQLEKLPAGEMGMSFAALLTVLPEPAQAHVAGCANCQATVQDFVDTRQALQAMRLPEPGPWFAAGVMRAIAREEQALEESQSSFWANVRRLAPRMVAFATLLLMLGGTWAFQERRAAARMQGTQLRPVEGVFETSSAVPANDDIFTLSREEKKP